MPSFRAYTSRGAVLIWRQSGFELPGTGTAAPRSKWLLMAPRGAAFVYALPRATDSSPATFQTAWARGSNVLIGAVA